MDGESIRVTRSVVLPVREIELRTSRSPRRIARPGLHPVLGRLVAGTRTAVQADVRKQSVAELEASGLAWAQVDKPIQVRARAWFLSGSAS